MKRSELKQIIREVIEESTNNTIDIDGIYQAIKDEGLIEKYQECFSDLNKTPRFVSNGTSLTMSNQLKFKTRNGDHWFISQQIFIYEKNINTLEIQISEMCSINTKVTTQYKDVKTFKNVGETSVVWVNKDKIMNEIRDAFDTFALLYPVDIKGAVIEDSKLTKRHIVEEGINLIGRTVKCKYATNGTGTIIKKQGATGWIVKFLTTKPFQDFTTRKITESEVEKTMFMKNADIVILDRGEEYDSNFNKLTKNSDRPLVNESVEIQIDKIIDAYRNYDKYQRSDFLYGMAGPRNVGFRQSVMSALVGRLVPKTQCGIHAIESELNKAIKQ